VRAAPPDAVLRSSYVLWTTYVEHVSLDPPLDACFDDEEGAMMVRAPGPLSFTLGVSFTKMVASD
jgi:hypothetical protein